MTPNKKLLKTQIALVEDDETLSATIHKYLSSMDLMFPVLIVRKHSKIISMPMKNFKQTKIVNGNPALCYSTSG